MKEYCTDCLNVFETSELESCICNLMGKQKRTIVTKSGVKVIEDRGLHCKDCLEMKHKHIGESFI